VGSWPGHFAGRFNNPGRAAYFSRSRSAVKSVRRLDRTLAASDACLARSDVPLEDSAVRKTSTSHRMESTSRCVRSRDASADLSRSANRVANDAATTARIVSGQSVRRSRLGKVIPSSVGVSLLLRRRIAGRPSRSTWEPRVGARQVHRPIEITTHGY